MGFWSSSKKNNNTKQTITSKQTQIISEKQEFAAKFHFSSVLLYIRRVLYINGQKNYSSKEMLGQELFYLPKSKKHEHLSLIDACDSFRNLSGCDIKDTNIMLAFNNLKKMFNINDPFIINCLNLIELALNGKPQNVLEDAYNSLYDETKEKFENQPSNSLVSEAHVNKAVQEFVNTQHQSKNLLKNINSEESKRYIEGFDELIGTKQNSFDPKNEDLNKENNLQQNKDFEVQNIKKDNERQINVLDTNDKQLETQSKDDNNINQMIDGEQPTHKKIEQNETEQTNETENEKILPEIENKQSNQNDPQIEFQNLEVQTKQNNKGDDDDDDELNEVKQNSTDPNNEVITQDQNALDKMKEENINSHNQQQNNPIVTNEKYQEPQSINNNTDQVNGTQSNDKENEGIDIESQKQIVNEQNPSQSSPKLIESSMTNAVEPSLYEVIIDFKIHKQLKIKIPEQLKLELDKIGENLLEENEYEFEENNQLYSTRFNKKKLELIKDYKRKENDQC